MGMIVAHPQASRVLKQTDAPHQRLSTTLVCEHFTGLWPRRLWSGTFSLHRTLLLQTMSKKSKKHTEPSQKTPPPEPKDGSQPQSTRDIKPWGVIGIAALAGVLSFLVGLAAANIYFRLAEIGASEELGKVFSPDRDITTFSRLCGQYAFCNVLQWIMENHALSLSEIALIPGFSFIFVFLLAILYMPRTMWSRVFSVKIAVVASSVHGITVCLMLILWSSLFSEQFAQFIDRDVTRWRLFHGELTGWLPMAMAITLLWNIFLGSLIGGLIGWILESFRAGQTSSVAPSQS